ncbi:unnamed protein product [Larinioides sclopetarius]|uniref:Transmembrane protein n=1 Tax=Larinioides sclopetarius TaxID=280406 RepID=A0AAV2B5Q7_9ARAC
MDYFQRPPSRNVPSNVPSPSFSPPSEEHQKNVGRDLTPVFCWFCLFILFVVRSSLKKDGIFLIKIRYNSLMMFSENPQYLQSHYPSIYQSHNRSVE